MTKRNTRAGGRVLGEIRKKALKAVPVWLEGKLGKRGFHYNATRLQMYGKWAHTPESDCISAFRSIEKSSCDLAMGDRVKRRNEVLIEFLCPPGATLELFASRCASLAKCAKDRIKFPVAMLPLDLGLFKIWNACQEIPKDKRPPFTRQAKSRELSLIDILDEGGKFVVTSAGLKRSRSNGSYNLSIPAAELPRTHGKPRRERLEKLLKAKRWTNFFP